MILITQTGFVSFSTCTFLLPLVLSCVIFLQVFEWLGIKRVLNVTPSCPNQHEGKGVIYRRIPVSDTGTQKLSNKFEEAFEFIGRQRACDNSLLRPLFPPFLSPLFLF